MELTGNYNVWIPILFGVFGGVVVELLQLYNLRYKGLPEYAKDLWFWIISSAMALSGGVLVFAYLLTGMDITPILAINIGATAPLILASIASNTPNLSPPSN